MRHIIPLGVLAVLFLFASACETTSGTTPVDGDVIDGDVTDGDVTDGDVVDGDVVDGDAADGDLDADFDTDGVDGDEIARAEQFTVVTVDPNSATSLQLAVYACAGLHNRRLGGSIYMQRDDHDRQWLNELQLEASRTVEASEFLASCVTEFPRCVRYNYANQQKLIPNILTIGAVLDALPLEEGMSVACGEVVFDATTEFAEKNTPYLATQYVFENYIEQTTGLAMLNPGYDTSPDNVRDPALTFDMAPILVDYVFARKLFTVFLVNGCRDESPEKELLHQIVNAGHWPTPVGVYGYNNSWNVLGGYLYEAQTQCLESRNMGAIPSGRENLSFFATRRGPITDASQLARNEPQAIDYDPAKTYVAFVVGDGDNIRFIMTSRKTWLRERLANCEQAQTPCQPISWSISPHLTYIAPDVLDWYYAASSQTGSDYFILPPSGHHYAYPTSLNKADQDRFVAATEADARILGVQGVVHWEWNGSWRDAEEKFLPKYASADGAIRGIFPVNVPYLLPAFTWWAEDQFYNILTGKDGGRIVVFRPREWRGVDNDDDVFFLSPQKMAEELGGYPAGTVTWVYMTSDGGLNLDNSFNELVRILPEHVVLVSADTAARLALAAEAD